MLVCHVRRVGIPAIPRNSAVKSFGTAAAAVARNIVPRLQDENLSQSVFHLELFLRYRKKMDRD